MNIDTTETTQTTETAIGYIPCYAQVFSRLFFGDCLIESDKIEDYSVDMILTDLPYGTTACSWDEIIPFEPMWKMFYRVLRPNGFIVLTASQPFTSKLVSSNIDNFSHNWVWNKKRGTGHLLAKKRPMMASEDIVVFTNELKKHDNTGENPVREYLVSEKKKSGMTNKDFNLLFSKYTNKEGCTDRSVIEHYWGKAQFTFPTQEIYENVLQPTGYFQKPYSYIYELGKPYRENNNKRLGEKYPRVFNPQMRERIKSRLSKNNGNTEVYGTQNKFNGKILEESYPINIIEFDKSGHSNMLHHPTQKPIELLEEIILTYSNEDHVILDNTMGSGSTGVACRNLNRNFIGIEKDKNYFEIAKKRIYERQICIRCNTGQISLPL